MADRYYDPELGSDSNDGSTWALAKLTIEAFLGIVGDGDRGFARANNNSVIDTTAAARTLSFSTSTTNPSKIIAVKFGTTNEGSSIVASDVCVLGTDILPHIQNTGGNDMTVSSSSVCNVSGLKIDTRRLLANGQNLVLNDCTIVQSDRFHPLNHLRLVNCNVDFTSSACNFRINSRNFEWIGGIVTFSGTVDFLFDSTPFPAGQHLVDGLDIGGWATGQTLIDDMGAGNVIFRNIKTPASFTAVNTIAHEESSITLINLSDSTSMGATDSYQDYEYHDFWGSIVDETTVVRTGGADDDASGAFAYAMTVHSDVTQNGTEMALKSMWCEVWVEAGSATLTLFIANDTASTDYNEDEVKAEFLFPNSNDTAQHEFTRDSLNAYKVSSTTAVTDDTGSTWGTGGNNHQKFTAAINPGFEGWAYARVVLSKRQTTPDTLYLDPKLDVS